MAQFLLTICGIPASGKTSLAEALRSTLDKTGKVRIVSTDVWRDEQYYADFKPENERAVRSKALVHTKQHLADGFSVISDDTNYYQSMRHEMYDLARQAESAFGIVFVNTPLETAIIWNKMRESSVPEEVVKRINDRLDVPGSKYAWDAPIHIVDLSVLDIDTAASEIAERLNELGPLSQAEQPPDNEATKRLLDVVTRQTVARFLDSCPEIRNYPEVSVLRREILKTAKDEGLSAIEAEKELMRKLMKLTVRES